MSANFSAGQTSFMQAGFLSDGIENTISQIKNDYREEIKSVEMTSQEVTDWFFSHKVTGVLKQSDYLAFALWSRCMSSCQAAVLLGKRGMREEALTLLRNAFEGLCFSVALVKDAEVAEKMSNQDRMERSKQARAMLDDEDTNQILTDEQKNGLNNQVLDNGHGLKGISVYDAAKIAGMAQLYHTLYRGLSLEAAHPSVTTAESAMDKDFSILFKPSVENLACVFDYADAILKMGQAALKDIRGR
ncbi:DUF5677 domain-containing protein [Chromobacterium subtsugae]|uniref:DUF5677 domain-containing protein n=1 Tax=Chromobacterium subtsugae TaxID=251747 RepID=UPI000AD97CC9|nr:DUF5677 domain-containing protein [Chromobacterium subtsugae]